MTLSTQAHIAQQQPGIQSAIETVCQGTTLDNVWNPQTLRDLNNLHCFICMLGNLGLPLWKIAAQANVSKDYAREILKARRAREVPVRTQRYS